MIITMETRLLVTAALAGDPALALLAVAGSSPETLAVDIAPGVPARSIGGCSYSPEPPFRRETLVDLIVRMQRLRWRRAAPFVPAAMPPEERDLQLLHKRHGRAAVGFECGPGWADLLDAVFSWLHDIAPDREWSPSQIKEKYGTLRFYWHGDLPDLGDEIIAAAEHLSGHLCEACGAPGLLHSDGGWTLPGGGLYLIGEVSGHPRIADGLCTTSTILAIDARAGWVRTISRYYRLGPKLGQSLQ